MILRFSFKFNSILSHEMGWNMSVNAVCAQQVKDKFKQQGLTFTAWAKQHGYRVNDVYRVLNGQVKANYGKGHEIAVKLGLKKMG